MPWHKPADQSIVVFECDTCDQVVDCDVEQVRATATRPEPETSDFVMCWRYMQGIGWRSFKRTGRNWSYHCVTCGPAAEIAHRDHQHHENERDRIRARNAA